MPHKLLLISLLLLLYTLGFPFNSLGFSLQFWDYTLCFFPILYLRYTVAHYMCGLMVVMFALILSLRYLCFLLHTQRILLLFSIVILLVFYLLIVYRLQTLVQIPLLMIWYFLLSWYSYNSCIRLQSRYIFVGILLILRSVVGRMLSLLLQTLFRNGFSLVSHCMRTLWFSLFSNRIH